MLVNVALIRNRVFVGTVNLNKIMSSSWIRVGPNFNSQCCYKETHLDMDKLRKDSHVMTEAGIGLIHLRTKEWHGLPATTKDKTSPGKIIPRGQQRENVLWAPWVHTSSFQNWDNKSLLSISLSSLTFLLSCKRETKVYLFWKTNPVRTLNLECVLFSSLKSKWQYCQEVPSAYPLTLLKSCHHFLF